MNSTSTKLPRSRMTTAPPKWKDAYEAAKNGDLAAVRSYIEKDTDMLTSTNDQGKSLALIAARKNDTAILEYVLERNATMLLLSDHSGSNIMQYAIDNNNLGMVKYLVEQHSWDVHHQNVPSLGNTPIHHATKMKRFQILKYFLEEKEGDVNVRNYREDPPVFLAAENASMKIIRYLVEERGADLTLTNSYYENILFVATRAGHLDVLHYILEDRQAPLDINATDKAHRTILYLAVEHKYPRIIKYLIQWKRADVNIVDAEWNSPLHIAADAENLDICKYLVDNGANFKAKDKNGYIPMQHAINDELVQYFEEVIHERTRRSVIPAIPHTGYAPAHRLIVEGPTNREVASRSTGVEEAKGRGEFVTFLTVADVFVRCMKGSGNREPKRSSLLSVPEILGARMDPVAVEATQGLRVE